GTRPVARALLGRLARLAARRALRGPARAGDADPPPGDARRRRLGRRPGPHDAVGLAGRLGWTAGGPPPRRGDRDPVPGLLRGPPRSGVRPRRVPRPAAARHAAGDLVSDSGPGPVARLRGD